MAKRAVVGPMPISTIGRTRCGFTLLELLVALSIMTIFSGTVLVAMWPALEEARLCTGTRLVIAALRYARDCAVTQQMTTEVVFDTDRRGVSVQRQVQDDAGQQTWQTITTQAGRFRTLPEGISFQQVSSQGSADEQNQQITVDFTPLGQAQETTITLHDVKGHQRTIHVDPVTGRCELVDQTP